MDRLTRVLAGLLGRAAGLLPGRRRDWAEAALAESGEIPAGARRAAWLAAGYGWSPGDPDPQRPADDRVRGRGGGVRVVQLDGSLLELRPDAEPDVDGRHSADPGRAAAGDPPPVRPVRGGWVARAVRVGGYALILVMIAAKAVKDRDGSELGQFFAMNG
jgi:hypothetical protein